MNTLEVWYGVKVSGGNAAVLAGCEELGTEGRKSREEVGQKY